MACDIEVMQQRGLIRGRVYVLRARVSIKRHVRNNQRYQPVMRNVLIEKSNLIPTKSNAPKYINIIDMTTSHTWGLQFDLHTYKTDKRLEINYSLGFPQATTKDVGQSNKRC